MSIVIEFFGKLATIGIGVALAPVLVPAAIVKVAHDEITQIRCKECGCKFSKNDEDAWDDQYCSYECYLDAEDDKEEERERQQQQKVDREKDKNRRRIKSEIDNFKNISKRQINDKYGIRISFNDVKVNIPDDGNSKIAHLKKSIKESEDENSEIQTLIGYLQKAKDAV